MQDHFLADQYCVISCAFVSDSAIAGFKIRFLKGSASSILAPGTNKKRFSEILELRDTDLQDDDVHFSVNDAVVW